MILLGDLNIINPEHKTMQALLDAGFATTEGIKNAATSLSGKHHYASKAEIKRISHGRDGTARAQDKAMDYFRNYYRKHQLSEHNLLWCEVKTDFSGHYLDAIAAGRDPRKV